MSPSRPGRRRSPSVLRWLVPALALALVSGGTYALSAWRLDRLATRPLSPTRFEHAAHRSVSCTACHHNFVGERLGGKRCYACHKALTGSAGMRIDTAFHAFCTSCHRSERAAVRRSGPVKACSACHLPERPTSLPVERVGQR
jgi:predicted CXXCH cytochrome family protein